MNIDIAILAFFFFMLSYLLICEIFTILFRLTGLTEETARFQVISMLTNCGYTTGESEIIMGSKKRRKLAFLTILFGYIFTVTIVSMVVNIFLTVSSENSFQIFSKGGIAILAIVIIWYLIFKIGFIKTSFDRAICKIGVKTIFKNPDNPILILGIFNNNVIAEIFVSNLPEDLDNTPLKDAEIRKKYNLQILTIIRDGEYNVKVDGETIVNKNDRVIIFGTTKNIKTLFVKEKKFY